MINLQQKIERGWSESVEFGNSRFLNGLIRSVSQNGWGWKGLLEIISTLTKQTVIFQDGIFYKQNALRQRTSCSTVTIKSCWSYGNSKLKEAPLPVFISPSYILHTSRESLRLHLALLRVKEEAKGVCWWFQAEVVFLPPLSWHLTFFSVTR